MKEKIAKVLLIGAIIGVYKVLYAPEELKKEGKKDGEIEWVEGARGWDEDGTSLWTGISPLPNYNVGIGTSTPSQKLHVVGNAKVEGSLYINDWPIRITLTPEPGYVLKWNGSEFVPKPDEGSEAVGGSGSAAQVAFWTGTNTIGGSDNLWWDNTNARLGIGTSSPQYKLDVLGNSRIQGSLYINSWPISIPSPPTEGYVLKWDINANAFVPKPDESGGNVGGSGSPTQVAFWVSTNKIEGNNNLWWDNINSRLGIGTNSPYYTLHVIKAQATGVGTGLIHAVNTATYNDAAGVYGECASTDNWGYGGYFKGGYIGVYGNVSPTGSYDYYGVYGKVSGGSGSNYGVYGNGTGGSWSTGVYGVGGIWGVYGYSNNANGGGVCGFGETTASGVYGETNTPAGVVEAGVYGKNTNARGTGIIGVGSNVPSIHWSGEGDGVVGVSDAYGYGVIGSHYDGSNNNRWGALGTIYYGVYGTSDNPSGAAIFGYSETTTGVIGMTTNSEKSGIKGVNRHESGNGIFGFGSDVWTYKCSGRGDGVVGVSDAYGVVGSNYNGTNNDRWGALGTVHYGVYGSSDNTDDGAGVCGIHTAASHYVVGIYGTLSDPGTYDYIAVSGYDPNFNDGYGYGGFFYGGFAGVRGHNNYSQGMGIGVYGSAPSSGYAVFAEGRFAATGSKSAIVRTSKGPRELYCVESPEIWFTEVGSGKLINGRAHIELDPLFLETVTIDENNPMKVIITLTDEANGVYIKKGKTGFDVIELNGGKSNATFDYIVYAKRKGYENKRLEFTEAGYLDEHLYPDINDPEIPARIREKRIIQKEHERRMTEMWEKAAMESKNAKTVKAEKPKEPLPIHTVKVSPKYHSHLLNLKEGLKE